MGGYLGPKIEKVTGKVKPGLKIVGERLLQPFRNYLHNDRFIRKNYDILPISQDPAMIKCYMQAISYLCILEL